MNSIFRFLQESSPYIDRATAELRRPLLEMQSQSDRNAHELADMIDALGAVPVPREVAPDDQYLSYLSFSFLLPKLLETKQLMIRRYVNALAAIADGPPQVVALVKKQLSRHQADAQMLANAMNPKHHTTPKL